MIFIFEAYRRVMKTILIIEDDADILDLTTYLLNDAGYTVVASLTLRSVGYIKNLNPDLVLLDHRLLDGLGGKLCSEIKADDTICHIPVLIISADMNIEKIANYNFADGYIAKPFDIDRLITVVDGFF